MKRLLIVSAALVLLTSLVYASPLPDTGQTKCYDDTQEILCPQPGEDFYGQDAQYPCNPQSYTKLDENGNDLPDDTPWPWAMVRDNVTGLMWEVKTDDGSIHDKDNDCTWYDAQDIFISTLNSQNFGGHNDWRLPTIKELSTLFNGSIPYTYPTINTDYFPNTMGAWYWSSTAYNNSTGAVWLVFFANGVVYHLSKSPAGFISYGLAVRGSQTSNNFIDNLDGTVTDIDTGLMWQKETAPGTYNWQQALTYCENLSLAGCEDWRLPDRTELQSLVDYARFDPSIDTIFSNTEPYYYWSSTTFTSYGFPDRPSSTLIVNFENGFVNSNNKSNYNYLRAVRAGRCLSVDDSDNDGIPDGKDNCPTSDLKETIIINCCDSGVKNELFDDGCTMSDLIAECSNGAINHGKFVSCVSHLTNGWKKQNFIAGNEKGAMQSCAAQSDTCEGPIITITDPTTADFYDPPGTPSTISLAGTASDDDDEIVEVTWSNNRGGSGTASGTTNWSISDITLFCGDYDIITVSAEDSEGNIGTDTLTVDVAPCPPTGLRIIKLYLDYLNYILNR